MCIDTLRYRHLREVTSLAHAVEGVTIRLHCTSGDEVLVSSTCLGADLDPCALRATLLHERSRAPGRMAATIERIDFVAGLTPLGAGLYHRSVNGDERWFASDLDPAAIAAALQAADRHDTDHAWPGDAFETIVRPDHELGLHAVCVRSTRPTPPAELDEAAVWALGRVLVTELTVRLDHPCTEPRRHPGQHPGHPGHRHHEEQS